jgi:hypothetical protein
MIASTSGLLISIIMVAASFRFITRITTGGNPVCRSPTSFIGRRYLPAARCCIEIHAAAIGGFFRANGFTRWRGDVLPVGVDCPERAPHKEPFVRL